MSIEKIVKNDLCTGCGVCISEDESQSSKMVWNGKGFLVPSLTQKSTQEKMVKVCPFYKEQKTEDDLGKIYIKSNDTKYDEKLGYYRQSYAGYSNEFRKNSSSGGIATYVFKELLEQKVVDHIFIVKEVDGNYSYQIFNNAQDITRISKTRYTPVTLEKLFQYIDNIDGKIAVSGVACFVKAIRLKQIYNPYLCEKIPFIVGIICGGLKSKFYTDFLAQAAGCYEEYYKVEYRVKNKESTAINYKFSCIEKSNKKIHMVEMRTLGDMWGTGLFKSKACDFCDDVVTELADISLGDAWISPYSNNGLGNSIVIARTKLAEEIIEDGLRKNTLSLDRITEDLVIKSQQGSFNHRHNGLKYRINKTKIAGGYYPIKRKKFLVDQNFLLNKIQSLRMNIREESINNWLISPNFNDFMSKISHKVNNLRLYSALNRKLVSLVNYFRKFK